MRFSPMRSARATINGPAMPLLSQKGEDYFLGTEKLETLVS